MLACLSMISRSLTLSAEAFLYSMFGIPMAQTSQRVWASGEAERLTPKALMRPQVLKKRKYPPNT